MWKRIGSTSLGVRVAALSLFVLATVLFINNFVFVRGFSSSAQAAMVDKAKTFTALADETKNHVSALHKSEAFTTDELMADLKKDLAAGKPYTESRVFKTIPVVAGWMAAAEAAKKEHLEFHTPAFEARNRNNEPKSGTFESQLLRDLTEQVHRGGEDGIHRVDTTTNTLHYMRAIRLDNSCMLCHGDPATSPTKDGKDVLGFPMENWKVGAMHGAFHVAMPLNPVDQQISAFVTGSLAWTIPLFIGSGALLLWAMRRMVSRPIGRIVESLQSIANRDLTSKPLAMQQGDEVGRIAKATDAMADTLTRMVTEIRTGASLIDVGSGQIASASQSLAEGASEQASSLEEISASLEEISGQTQQSAENARQANVLAQENKQAADRGQQEMAEMARAVSEIKQSSGEISKIIKVIDEIAFQTNLLALNAAVEAARAGEAGKGFAVVAEEVRNLAQRSAEAAKSTSAMIEESVRRSEKGVQLAGRVGQVLEEITASTNKVNALLTEIAAASSEQATGIGQINQGVSQLDQVTQQNAGNSEELASSAQEMSSQVAQLNQLVAQFKVNDNGGAAPPARPAATPARSATPGSNRKPSRPHTDSRKGNAVVANA